MVLFSSASRGGSCGFGLVNNWLLSFEQRTLCRNISHTLYVPVSRTKSTSLCILSATGVRDRHMARPCINTGLISDPPTVCHKEARKRLKALETKPSLVTSLTLANQGSDWTLVLTHGRSGLQNLTVYYPVVERSPTKDLQFLLKNFKRLTRVESLLVVPENDTLGEVVLDMKKKQKTKIYVLGQLHRIKSWICFREISLTS